jgi:hypothetical protein
MARDEAKLRSNKCMTLAAEGYRLSDFDKSKCIKTNGLWVFHDPRIDVLDTVLPQLNDSYDTYEIRQLLIRDVQYLNDQIDRYAQMYKDAREDVIKQQFGLMKIPPKF